MWCPIQGTAFAPMPLSLEPGYLDWRAVFTLGANLTESDRLECLSGDPMSVLAGATTTGQAWTALRSRDGEDSPHEGRILGAYGYTDEGTIWSLWSELSREESMAVLTHTPLWVRTMLHESGREWLYNWVSLANQKAIAWLKLSGCFDVSDRVVTFSGMSAHYFRTKPKEVLAGV